MKTLVLVFHPHLEKSQVNRKLMDAANETGDVTVVDEYAAYPDFKINVEHEQELIETHDRIVLQFPFYWYSRLGLRRRAGARRQGVHVGRVHRLSGGLLHA